MARLHVYWKSSGLNQEAGVETSAIEAVHQGVLTDEHGETVGDEPVLVEEVSQRVYRSGDLPPGAAVYIEDTPEAELPPLAERAREAGFRIARSSTEGTSEAPR